MAQTQVGLFPIGFRRGWTDWQRDLPRVVAWSMENSFSHMDFGPITAGEAKEILAAGLFIASVDLQNWPELASPDSGRRNEAVQKNAQYIHEMAGLGITRFLTVVVPEEPQRSRLENFKCAVEGYSALCDAMGSSGGKLLLEGAPGKPPFFASIGCTPADLRSFLSEVKSSSIGVTFDPSHLVRMGIDPIRFLGEFGKLVYHVHAKDVTFNQADTYEHGNLQSATFAPPHRFGGHHWRYALPGRGVIDWLGILRTLISIGYAGRISIELEDKEYNGNEAAEQRGLVESRELLANLGPA